MRDQKDVIANIGTATISTKLDTVSDVIGRTAAWLTLLMVLLTFMVVLLRYALDTSFVWLQESLTWMHAVVFMLGASYTLRYEEHVRVDIFYRDMTKRRRALVDLIGVLIFIFPLCIFFAYESFDYVSTSWRLHEISRDAGGLPYPAIPLLKTLLLIMPVAVALQGLSLLLRSWQQLREQ